ncbi:MAG: hypothetical protein U5K30_00220 [Acidimicrobiales bacterium]|nr:hypothetical protein [Acidimicrobiales bacterium]
MAQKTRRRSTTPSFRSLGFEAAVGLDTRREPRDRRARSGRQCPHCATRGTVYMVDTARVRAYLVCPTCSHEWDTDRFDAIA